MLNCTTSSGNLDIDAVSLTDTSLPASAYVMDRVLLSPTSNPYGTPNASGIYIINCNNQNVTIGPCRIVGTLVLLVPGPGRPFRARSPGSRRWPDIRRGSRIARSQFPSPDQRRLGEATYGINFNDREPRIPSSSEHLMPTRPMLSRR